MAFSNRCVNCTITFNNPRTVSQGVLDLDTSLRDVLMSWILPMEVRITLTISLSNAPMGSFNLDVSCRTAAVPKRCVCRTAHGRSFVFIQNGRRGDGDATARHRCRKRSATGPISRRRRSPLRHGSGPTRNV